MRISLQPYTCTIAMISYKNISYRASRFILVRFVKNAGARKSCVFGFGGWRWESPFFLWDSFPLMYLHHFGRFFLKATMEGPLGCQKRTTQQIQGTSPPQRAWSVGPPPPLPKKSGVNATAWPCGDVHVLHGGGAVRAMLQHHRGAPQPGPSWTRGIVSADRLRASSSRGSSVPVPAVLYFCNLLLSDTRFFDQFDRFFPPKKFSIQPMKIDSALRRTGFFLAAQLGIASWNRDLGWLDTLERFASSE